MPGFRFRMPVNGGGFAWVRLDGSFPGETVNGLRILLAMCTDVSDLVSKREEQARMVRQKTSYFQWMMDEYVGNAYINDMENYDRLYRSEKIFYPPEELDTNDTPMAHGPAGTLAYYAPWGNVAIFYGDCGELYQLGEAVSGVEYIAEMTGEIRIKTVRTSFSSSAPEEVESTLPP